MTNVTVQFHDVDDAITMLGAFKGDYSATLDGRFVTIIDVPEYEIATIIADIDDMNIEWHSYQATRVA